jgi:hypothetical protein
MFLDNRLTNWRMSAQGVINSPATRQPQRVISSLSVQPKAAKNTEIYLDQPHQTERGAY